MHRTGARCSASVLYKDYPHARHITLNRPNSLNALDYGMTRELHRLYVTEPAPPPSLYILTGAGTKAFCAGGDVIGLTTNNPPGCGREFFYWEYQVDYKASIIPAGQVCLWDGYVLGGGAGLSIGSAYRVASEKACFAMPEVAIGMFPDVGASWFLPRLSVPGLGLYMGLTGHRLRGADLVHLGLATHFVPSAKMGELEQALVSMSDAGDVEAVLDKYTTPTTQLPPCTIAHSISSLASHFDITADLTISSILDACREHAQTDPLAKAAADLMPSFSPTAMTLALELLKRGAKLSTPVEAFQMEYCVSQRIIAEHDFREGVRALLIDKDKKPKWQPSTVAEVSAEAIDAYFRPTTPDQPVWDPVAPLSERAS
ncbi:putative 3-hydroxyisobutyryl-coenzyme A hydrolase [Leishmania major strain Friedlin]|uniref:3-hydroxyisobutyryl-CoA hydrolase n=1 Tax=Leishmania major TaxID=5664 RepID=Q4Q4Q4_LEIMA|nr:putative 3-hydroxyisobutyryl-coenzyme A hydrolase [Leishmania major strain Friedlin]CAG9580518.1 3-hydroxyisobutyryl-coenzyme_A_hydrolase_-_putative [Leishmania major strain Friedlin]CAJ08899.1 putative 3-hydroxyisobutyryl-coenzyme A hydrolase [Leishmania major strain Friedlin]|eukprot:XP_001685694.1 putative 3-hydroxyisobutyryl-coenzyme A hydrolase [Leishmania major strain Friedlin]